MSKFFTFENYRDHHYTFINIDEIIAVHKKLVCQKDLSLAAEGHVFVKFGNDVKEYILDEDQIYRLMDKLKEHKL